MAFSIFPERNQTVTGGELRAWRERRGWSTYDAAEETGLSRPSFSRWETGQRPVRPYVERITHLINERDALRERVAKLEKALEKESP